MRRWLIGIAVCLLALVVVAAAGVYLVLKSDLPRQWILQAAAEQTGLHVQAEAVSIRWSGRTTVHDLALRMPLSDRDFLSAETIELWHRSVPALLLTRSLGLRSVRVASPHALLWRDEEGRWNAQEVVDRLVAVAGSSGSVRGAVTLPDVDIRGGQIEIVDPNGSTRIVGPLVFQGTAAQRHVWTFALQTPDGIGLHGKLAEGGNWTHHIEFDVEPNPAVLEAVWQRPTRPVRAAGRWDGRVEKGGLQGVLRLEAFGAGPVALTGAVRVAMQQNGVMLSPERLVMTEPNYFGQELYATGGRVRIGATGLAAEELLVETATMAGQLNGRWDLDVWAGAGSATWAGRLPGLEGEYGGTARVAVKSPPHGLKEAQLTTTVEARTPLGVCRLAMETEGMGGRWRQSLWRTSLDKLTWTRDQEEVDLSGAAAEVSIYGSQVQLTNLSLPNAGQVSADARLNLDTLNWAVRLDADGMRLRPSEEAGMTVRLRSEGDSHKAVVSELRVVMGQVMAAAKGELALPSTELRNAHISAQWPDRPAPGATPPAPGESRGQWGYEFDITGRAQPVALDAGGKVTGRNVRLGKRRIAQLEIPIQARVDTERIEIATSPFTLLEGRWQLSGKHELADPRTELHLTIADLSLQTAAEMAGSPVKCQGQAAAQLQLSVPQFQLEKALAFGSWDVADLNVPPFEAERGHGQIRISGGLVRFDEIQLVQGQGQARGAMWFRLDQPQRLSAKLNLVDWPLQWAARPVALVTDSDVELQLDVLKKTLDGQGQLSSRLLLEDKEFGRLSTSLRMRERTLEVQDLQGELLGGLAHGSAQIPLDRLTASTGQLQWRDIEPALLAPWWAQAARASGKLSGSLTAVQTAEEHRPLEPLRVNVQARMSEGRFGQAHVSDCNIVAYAGNRRFLVDESSLRLLGGRIKARARVSPHAGKLYLSVSADVNSVDLGQVTTAIDPNAKPLVGRLSGTGTLVTSSDWRRLSGQADLAITQSDLVNNPIVRTLYGALSLDLGQIKPEGTGQIDVLFEGTRVRIPSFVYFNRGVEIRGAGTIRDVALGPDSPVDGYAVGSTRVLKGVRLPGVRQLDRLMSSLQTGIASVTIRGTVEQTKVNLVPLPVVGDALRGLLWRQLHEEQ